MKRPNIQTVVEDGLCLGCGLCVALAPKALELKLDEAGFLRPFAAVELDLHQPDSFERLCPGFVLPDRTMGAHSGDDDVLWGPVLSTWLVASSDPVVRWRGSSGGALTATLQHLLDTGAVEAATVAGPDPADPTRTVSRIARDRSAVLDSAGSRYAPSAPLLLVNELLQQSDRAAFVGKPCDIAGLQSLNRVKPEIESRIPYRISFFCAGVPSVHATSSLVRHLGVEPSDVAELRYRGNGWPGRFSAKDRKGNLVSATYETSWGAWLSPHVQSRCKICPDATGWYADLSFGDGWHTGETGYPVFDDAPGQSVALARTAKGDRLIRELIDSGLLTGHEIALSTLVGMQPGQVRKRRSVAGRLLGLRMAGKLVPKYRGLHLLRAARPAGILGLIRGAAGTLRRALTGEW